MISCFIELITQRADSSRLEAMTLLRSAVHRRPCRASQKKKFTFGGTAARQSSFAPAIVVHPAKKAR